MSLGTSKSGTQFAGHSASGVKVPPAAMAAALRWGKLAEGEARKYKVASGATLLLKIAYVESGLGQNLGPSSAGARGWTQFMPETRLAYMRKYHIDPWAGVDQAFHATGIFMQTTGLAGYNPGSSTYISEVVNAPVTATMLQGGTTKQFSGVPGLEQLEQGVNAGEEAAEGVESAVEFLGELAETLLDFRKLGQLAAEAVAWFFRLIAKAFWDYVIAPIIHRTERAVTWYWANFFAKGTEPGSGFGYQLRANGGIITISFWALGYGLLWTGPAEGKMPKLSDPNQSFMGHTIKAVEGAVAKRKLTKPQDVKKKTPKKPKPKESSVSIEKVQEFSVSRRRPVKVGGTGELGRELNGGNRGQGKTQEKILLPPGVRDKTKAEQPSQIAPKPSGAGVGS